MENKQIKGYELFITKKYNSRKITAEQYAELRLNWEEYLLSKR